MAIIKNPTTVIIGGNTEKYKQMIDNTIVTIQAQDLQGLEAIGEHKFEGCFNLTSVDLPKSVWEVGDYAFKGCPNLASLSLSAPNQHLDVGNYAFSDCTSLNSVSFNTKTDSIGDYAFKGCTSLQYVYVRKNEDDDIPSVGTGAFDNTNNCPIYVPASQVSDFQSESGWDVYASRIQANPN